MVFQNYALFPHMTVFENIAFGLEVRKLSKSVIKEKVEKVQKLVHLDGYGSRKITELSGGSNNELHLPEQLSLNQIYYFLMSRCPISMQNFEKKHE